MNHRILAGLSLVALATASGVALAATNTTVQSVDVHESYVELAVGNDVCVSPVPTGWRKLPRIELSTGVRAELTLKLATAALLSGKGVTVETFVSGDRCHISYLQINN
jgi:hypothetical protein